MFGNSSCIKTQVSNFTCEFLDRASKIQFLLNYRKFYGSLVDTSR